MQTEEGKLPFILIFFSPLSPSLIFYLNFAKPSPDKNKVKEATQKIRGKRKILKGITDLCSHL